MAISRLFHDSSWWVSIGFFKKKSIFKDVIQIEVYPTPSNPIFDKFIVKTPTSTQHNTTVGFDNIMTVQTPPTHHPPTQTQYQQYLSCYWPDFDETLKVGSCEHLEQISIFRLTFVHATFVLATFVHIRYISAVTDQI